MPAQRRLASHGLLDRFLLELSEKLVQFAIDVAWVAGRILLERTTKLAKYLVSIRRFLNLK